MNWIVRFFKAIHLFVFFLKEVIVSSFEVSIQVIKPNLSIKPAIIAVPLDIRKPTSITLLANMITMTPGTMSVDVSSDQSHLFVYSLFVVDLDKFRKEIKGNFEQKIKDVLE